ncbi:MAG: hypothetical protein IPJ13_15695 [Saprospiraceae bacterium]|nr:hypothetical protein [Saprospiraceae bacterium]
MQTNIKYINILFFVLPTILFSQKDTTKTDLKINQVEVVKAFEVTLEESRKTDVKPCRSRAKTVQPEL